MRFRLQVQERFPTPEPQTFYRFRASYIPRFLYSNPIAKGSVYKGNYSYPRRGEKFRLGMKFTSTAQAQKAMNALEDGTKTLKDFVNTFDTTPNLTRKQICECL